MGKNHNPKPPVQVEETEVVLPKASYGHPDPVGAPGVEGPQGVKGDKGVVVNCARLNVRRAPSTKSGVLCEIARDDNVVIDMDKSKPEWYSVCTEAGVVGYCMKKYIQISQ